MASDPRTSPVRESALTKKKNKQLDSNIFLPNRGQKIQEDIQLTPNPSPNPNPDPDPHKPYPLPPLRFAGGLRPVFANFPRQKRLYFGEIHVRGRCVDH
jgi:hypothetical protein